MKKILATAAALMALSGTAALAEGDAAKGEKDFKKCKACHGIVTPEGEEIWKLAKTGPNLWGVIGRQAGTQADYEKYGDDLVAAGEAGLVWTEENLAEYAADPKKFLRTFLDDNGARSMMTFKLKKAENVAAYLATLSAE